jgi:hypothetical protein
MTNFEKLKAEIPNMGLEEFLHTIMNSREEICDRKCLVRNVDCEYCIHNYLESEYEKNDDCCEG